MKQIIALLVMAVLAILAWRIIETMSSDALGLAVGVVLGVLAGLPSALLVLASSRQAPPPLPRSIYKPMPRQAQIGYGEWYEWREDEELFEWRERVGVRR